MGREHELLLVLIRNSRLSCGLALYDKTMKFSRLSKISTLPHDPHLLVVVVGLRARVRPAP